MQRIGNPWVAWGPAEELLVQEIEVGGELVGGFSLPEGTAMALLAEGLNRPRDLEWAEDVLLVSEMGANRVVAITETKGESLGQVQVLVNGLSRPHGLTYQGGFLFVADEVSVRRYRFNPRTLEINFDRKILDLPGGGRHFTRTLDFDGSGRLYISLGSSCDTCVESHPWIATVLVTNGDGDSPRVYSQGLRNAVFVKHRPGTGEIWSTEMGRDFLGDSLPPDEINVLQDGGHFGWPYCYGDRVWDSRFGQRDQGFCNSTVQPRYNLPAHVAPLGLTFIDSPLFPSEWQGDLLVALHGSWNSTVPVGYKVIRLKLDNGQVTGMSDLITGFVKNGEAASRPVDVEFGSQGELYLSDDKGGKIFVLR
jgi:glucose/arabinose dehydrogenase